MSSHISAEESLPLKCPELEPPFTAASLVSLLLNSLTIETPQSPSPSAWPKQHALEICLEAVELLKCQLKHDGHIGFLPSWIKNSEFVKQYEEDYPDELLKLDDHKRIFELPKILNEENVVRVLDNIRYFGITDDDPIEQSFRFYIDDSNRHLIDQHQSLFPELESLWENVEFSVRCSSDLYFAEKAASHNYFFCLRYAHENGCEWKNTCWIAACGGFIDSLKFAHENGCPWNETTCSGAANGGHFKCLKYAHVNGCAWDKLTCSCAAGRGNLTCLRYAHENGCPWDEDTYLKAAEGGHLNCLQYAHENRCQRHVKTCSKAAQGGHLNCLIFAYEQRCPWDEDTCSSAAGGGHLDCLMFAHENRCPWNEETCCNAAKGGHLDCLKYAHENGCPWDEETCLNATIGGHLDCLKYAHENGCPLWDENNSLLITLRQDNNPVMDYARKHGFPGLE